MSTESHSKHLQNKDLDNFSKTGYSNSRLDVNEFYIANPKLTFDAMTIVGNLNKNNAEKLSKFMSIDP
ncbi:replication initiation protein, partial [Staphylococcus aureus Tur-12]